MNRRSLVILAAFGLLLSACTGGGNEPSPSSGQPAGPVTLTFWHGYTDAEADSLNALLEDWSAEHPDITIEPPFCHRSGS